MPDFRVIVQYKVEIRGDKIEIINYWIELKSNPIKEYRLVILVECVLNVDVGVWYVLTVVKKEGHKFPT